MAKAKQASEPDLTLPPSWLSLVGMETLLATWRSLVASASLPPALLLVGREGTGKRALLAALAAMHYCERGSACGVCSACSWLLSGSHPEVLWLEVNEGSFLSEHAARLQEHLELSPGLGSRYRTVVVVDADRLTEAAANRLLKTFEEPPPGARLLLSTSRVGAMLPTVLSRLVRWQVAPPPLAASIRWLQEQLQAEGRSARSEDELAKLLRRCALAPGLVWRELQTEAEVATFDFASLHAANHAGQMLHWAERLTRREGWPAAALLTQWELALNEDYRRALDTGEDVKTALLARVRQRHLLREARALVRGARVPLNAQLLCEALALTQAP